MYFTKSIKWMALSLFLSFSSSIFANNIRISSIGLVNDSIIQFSISWDNSWNAQYAPANHDAAWVFIKKRDCASLTWSHVDLSKDMADHHAGAPLEVAYDNKDVGNFAKGVYLKRATFGAGHINEVSVTLKMKGAVSGEFDFQVFATEMVYIPQGAFYVGDGTINAAYNSFYKYGGGLYQVTSENALSTTSIAGNLYYSSGRTNTAYSANFPKGYKSFYVMKYEISQGQYVDFLNTLNSDQAAVRYVEIDINRINIQGVWPEITTKYPYRAMGNLSWEDLLTFLDWCALRPMSELEFEKICRGPNDAVVNEYAWGNTMITGISGVDNDGEFNEQASTVIAGAQGIANYSGGPGGPMRTGFAAKVNTTRFSSGASYYGAMEMAGNVIEQTVGVILAASGFTGLVGNGEISTSPNPGLFDVVNWPGYTGRILRGGSFSDGNTKLATKNRVPTIASGTNGRRVQFGGRGVR